MSNFKENIIKTVLILIGGGLLYYAFKPSSVAGAKQIASDANTNSNTAAFDSKDSKENTPEPTEENANVVADAYAAAIINGEPPVKLTELNQECMKEFGMRAYIKDNTLTVCDVSGKVMLTRQP